MRPLLQANVEIMRAAAMTFNPGSPKMACSAAVPTRSCGALAMAAAGRTFRYATFASTCRTVTMSTPAPMATGRSRWAFLSSLPANPTLFHASIEKREPTIAAPIVPRPTVAPPVAQKLAPKLAANASALRPMVMPSRISKASAPDGRNGHGLDNHEQGPAVQVPEQGRDGFTQVHVLPARAGEHRRQLAVGERAHEGDDPGGRPDDEQQARGMDFAKHLRRDDE